jgi:hypothetical protein
MNMPPDEVMRMMAKLANEQAMQSAADFADRFANDPRMALVNGQVALRTFASAIRETNAKVWPKSGGEA